MDLLPTDEQSEIAATVRAQLEAGFALATLAEHDGDDRVIDDDLWLRCAELGWFGLGLAESAGGVGYGLAEEALLFEELGAHCTPGPFLATVLGAHVAAGAGDDSLISAVLTGERRVALAEPEGPTVRITDHGGADLLLVLDGDAAALVDATGVELTVEPSFDSLVPLARATLDAEPICRVEDPVIARRATVLVTAELAGIARATATQSTEYAKDREQFGRPVGSFQSVKHRCADMEVRAEAAVQLTHLAAVAFDADRPDASFQAHAARVVATAAAIDNAEINVQNHGGIGFTWEHTAHRYVTRARMRARTAGTSAGHLADLLAEPSPG